MTDPAEYIHMCACVNCVIYIEWSALGKFMFERWAKVLTFFGRTPKVKCVEYSHKRRFKREHMAHAHLLWGLCLWLNNIRIKTPSLESRAIKELKIARAFNLILHLQYSVEFEEGVCIKMLFPEFVYRHFLWC